MNRYIFIILFITGVSVQINGQDAYPIDFIRNKILSKLTFVYVDQPHLPKSNRSASEVLSNSDIANDQELTGNFWTNTNNRGSQDLVKKLLQVPQTRDDSLLQYIVGTVLRIQDKRVKVYLFNDWNNTSLTRYHPTWGINADVIGDSTQLRNNSSSPWVWPHAMHRIQGEFTGYLCMGSAFLNEFIGGTKSGLSTIIHELVHTQDNAEYVGVFQGVAFGRDGSHRLNELMSNYYLPYSEGMANAFEYRYNIPSTTYFDDLQTNAMYSYETTQSWHCANLPANSCLDQYLLNTHSKSPDTSLVRGSGANAYNIEFYKIRDLPSDVLIQNETVQAYIFYAFMHYFSAQELALKLASLKTQTNRKYGFPIIFEAMVDASVDLTVSRGQINNSRYFPLAVLDFFTGFKLTDKDVLIRCLRIRNNDSWANNIDDYWTPAQRGWAVDRYQNHYSNQLTPALLRDIASHFHIIQ